MKVLMVSLDRKIFEERDPTRARLAAYGEVFDELHIVVYATKNVAYTKQQIAPNVWVYPTQSLHKVFYIPDAVSIARTLSNKGVTIDIVSGQDLAETGIAAWCIARRLKVPLQLQDHADVFDPYFAKESIGNKIRVHIASFLLPKANCIRTVLPSGKERIASRFPALRDRISVLPVYTSVSAWKDTIPSFSVHERFPQFSYIALMASRLVPQKDIEFALYAFKNAEVGGSGLLVVGEGRLQTALENTVRLLGLEDRVVFFPWEKDLVSFYKTADLFLLSSRYESYCRTLVEATAAGLPFVSTDVGIARTLVESGASGSVIAHDDLEGFAQAIKTALEAGKGTGVNGLEAISRLQGATETEYRERYRATLERCATFS